MSWIMVDIEADGPIPGDYSMISFGAVVVEPGLERTYHGELRPISEKFVPEALAVSGFTREQTLALPEPEGVMRKFASWVAEVGAEVEGQCLDREHGGVDHKIRAEDCSYKDRDFWRTP
jgi:DNA polymerase III epsilon subunit-like protein